MSTTRDVFDLVDELESDTASGESDPDPDADTDADADAGIDTDTDTDTEADDTEADAAEKSAPGRLRRRRRRIVAVAAIAASAATFGTIGYLGWRLHQVTAVDAAQQAALAAAKDYAITLTTLDAGNLDENYTRALDGATGEFKEAYSLGSAQLRQMLIDNNAAGKGVVVDAAVKSATTTRAEVLLFVDQAITNAVRTEPRIDRNRIQMTMELVDGRWLASQVELT